MSNDRALRVLRRIRRLLRQLDGCQSCGGLAASIQCVQHRHEYDACMGEIEKVLKGDADKPN